MTCSDNACGTGGYAGPAPGDPDSNSILTATPAFGGIDLNWTPPGQNPQAVAFVRVYRSLVEDWLGATYLADVGGGGTFYYDKLDDSTQYWYWIQFYSANTGLAVGDPIGPATAMARPAIAAVLEGLTSAIDLGMLAQSLKTEIARIGLLDQAITNERTSRQDEDGMLAQTMSQVQAAIDTYSALVNQEVTARTNGQDALAQAITTVQTAAGDNLASVQQTLQTSIDTTNGQVTEIGARYTVNVDVNGLVGGFGVYNDGSSVEAGFNVDKFWIGRTGPDKKKPFIVDGTTGEVFINEAVIQKLTFDKLRAADGSLIVANGKVQANYLQVLKIMGGAYGGYAWPAAGQNGFYLGPEGLLLGNANNGKYMQVTADGNIYAPGFKVENGALSISQVNVIGTDNITNRAVTDVEAYTWQLGGSNNYPVSVDVAIPAGSVVALIASAQGLNKTGNQLSRYSYTFTLNQGNDATGHAIGPTVSGSYNYYDSNTGGPVWSKTTPDLVYIPNAGTYNISGTLTAWDLNTLFTLTILKLKK